MLITLFYSIFSEIDVSNGISSLSSSLDLEVIHPEPKDLQLGMLSGHDLDLPSCIPAEFNVTHLLEDEEAILAVFVNTSIHLEASVAMGTNLTFTFSFEDSGEILTQICETCTSVIQVRVTNLLDIFFSISTDLKYLHISHCGSYFLKKAL